MSPRTERSRFRASSRLLVASAVAIAAIGPTAGTAAAAPVKPVAPLTDGQVKLPPPGPEGELYLPEVNSERIAVIDTHTNRVKRYYPMHGGASKPAVLAVTPDGSKIYSNNFGQIPPTVTVIDTKAKTTKNIGTLTASLGAFTSADGTEIYLPEEGFAVQVIDVATDKIVRTLPYPEIPVASISGPGGHMYLGTSTGFVVPVNPKTGKPVRPPLHTGGLVPFWFTFTKDESKMYVDVMNSIAVVDMKSWKVVKRIETSQDQSYSLLGNPGAFTSTLSPDGSKLYVTMFGRPNVMVIDTKTDKVIGEIPTRGHTTAVHFSGDGSRGYISDLGPTSDNHPGPIGETVLFYKLIFFGTLGEGQLVVFDPKDDKVLGQIPTGRGPGIPVFVGPNGAH